MLWENDTAGLLSMKSNNPLSKRLAIFFGVLLLTTAGGWFWWADATAPVAPQDTKPEIFVVRSGEGVRTIAANLSSHGLIRSPTAFFILVKFMGLERTLQAGDFRLNRTMNARDIAQELTHGYLDIWVTTLEGWRVEEIANRLAKDLDIPEVEFLKVSREGYMFPDTYLIPREATPGAIAKIFLDTFNQKVTAQMKEDAAKQDLSFDEVLILASIVEREGRTDSDRPIIAGILLKRLKADWPLQADATLQYALGYQLGEKTWWKKSLTDEDKKIRSPYNTYRNPGLPPAPISSPGLAAINAVLYPEDSPYWFYLHDPEGSVHYARTIEEHNDNIATFLQ